jgi:hypothetical protein
MASEYQAKFSLTFRWLALSHDKYHLISGQKMSEFLNVQISGVQNTDDRCICNGMSRLTGCRRGAGMAELVACLLAELKVGGSDPNADEHFF